MWSAKKNVSVPAIAEFVDSCIYLELHEVVTQHLVPENYSQSVLLMCHNSPASIILSPQLRMPRQIFCILRYISSVINDMLPLLTEAEFAFRLKKDLVPLRVQLRYNPDGWLGRLIGTKLSFDFSREENIESMVSNLVRDLGNKGRIRPMEQPLDGMFQYIILRGHHGNYSCHIRVDLRRNTVVVPLFSP